MKADCNDVYNCLHQSFVAIPKTIFISIPVGIFDVDSTSDIFWSDIQGQR